MDHRDHGREAATEVAGRLAAGAQYIAGELRPGTSGRTHAVVDPATGETVHSVRAGRRRRRRRARSRPPGRRCPSGPAPPPAERSDALHRLAAVLAAQAEDLALRRDAPVRQADPARPPASTCPAPSTTPPSSPARPAHLEGKAAGEYSGDHTSYVRREPIGVVGSIAPWNYPLQMAAWKILPAIAAGNTIVLKPAEITPLTSLMFAQACRRRRASRTAWSTSSPAPGQVAGEHLVGHPDVAMVSFTGSTAVGRRVAEIATAHGQARPPRARRQGALRRVRRRRPRGRRRTARSPAR